MSNAKEDDGGNIFRFLYLRLQLSHELEDKSLGVFFMLRVGKVQVCCEVLIKPRSKVMPSL